MSEEEFLRTVLEIARMFGWRSAHFRPAKTANGSWRTPVQGDGKGFPDLVLARNGEILFAELKSQTGKLSPEQRAWIDALGAEVWRPSDLQGIADRLRATSPMVG